MRTLDISTYEEYKRIMGLNSIDVGSRLTLIRAVKNKVNKKSGLYKLKKNQLIKILSK